MKPAANGRPFRFFAVMMMGWIALRLIAHSGSPTPHGPMAPKLGRIMPRAIAATSPPAFERPTPVPSARAKDRRRLASVSLRPQTHDSAINLLSFITPSADFVSHSHAPISYDPGGLPPPVPFPLSPPQPSTSRWQGSAWALWRPDGSGADIATAGRLGGSQVGVRVDYDLIPISSARTSAYVRASAALQSPASPEAAIGIAIQPARTIPVAIAAERRIALGHGARNATALMLVGGFGPTPLVQGVEAQAYVQSGVVDLRQRDAFIDGKFSLLTPLAQPAIRVGASVSGGAQPGAGRLDLGPAAQFILPLPVITTRFSVEWRQRIAGHAAPSSGLAITLGADF